DRFQSALRGAMPSCGARGQELGHSEEVVRSRYHVTRELRASFAFISGPAEAADGLHPAEDLLDTLADPLADVVADVSRRARVDGRPAAPCRVAGYMRGHVHRTAVIDKLEGVVALVTADG